MPPTSSLSPVGRAAPDIFTEPRLQIGSTGRALRIEGVTVPECPSSRHRGTGPRALPRWGDWSVPVMRAPSCHPTGNGNPNDAITGMTCRNSHRKDAPLFSRSSHLPFPFIRPTLSPPLYRRWENKRVLRAWAPRRSRCTRIVAFFSLIHTQKIGISDNVKEMHKKLEFLRPAGNPFDGRGCGTGLSHCGTVNDFAFLMNEGARSGAARAGSLG